MLRPKTESHADVTLPRYRDYQPTCFDSRFNYIGGRDRDHWYVAPCSRTRDADTLTESNFAACISELQADSTPGCEIHRFGHWACGWYELILIHPWRWDLVTKAQELADYLEHGGCILDDSDFYERENEAIEENWESFGIEETRKILESFLNLEEIEDYDIWKTRELVESAYPVMTTEGLDIKTLGHRLECAPLSAVWDCIDVCYMSPERIEEIDSAEWHALFKSAAKVINEETREQVEIPWYISVQYDPNQLTLF